MKRTIRLGILFLMISLGAQSQGNWEEKLDKDGIKVYTQLTDSSAIKAVKTVCTVNSSLNTLLAVLLDIDGSMDWVYATKSIKTLRTISPSELIYYSELNIPWPANNRDFIVQLKVTQDEKTKAVSVIGFNKPDYLPENKNVVRIRQSYSKWLITPQKNGPLKIEYVLQVDPGGNVPAWLVNLFAAKGPYETFKKLREQVAKAKYQKVSYSFIKELN